MLIRKKYLYPLIEFLLNEVTKDYTVIWPIHPRAKKQLIAFGLWERVIANKELILLGTDWLYRNVAAEYGGKAILTDSGGLQEECCVLGTPCLTLRWNTERPVTLRENGGASVLVGNNIDRIREEYKIAVSQERNPMRPELWDGKTAGRCLEAILKWGQE